MFIFINSNLISMATELDVVLTIIFSFLSILLFLLILKHKTNENNDNNKSKTKKKLPPGEMGLPWIGETFEFYKAQRKNRLFEEFVQPRKAKHGNIFKTMLMGSPTIVVSGVAANRFFLSNEFKLVVSSWPSSSVQLMGPNSIMEKQGDHHRYLRTVITSSLSSTGLEALVPKICSSIEKHLKTHWHGQDTISLFRSAKMLTFTTVLECLLGIPEEDGMLDMFEKVLEGVFALPVKLPGSKLNFKGRNKNPIYWFLHASSHQKYEVILLCQRLIPSKFILPMAFVWGENRSAQPCAQDYFKSPNIILVSSSIRFVEGVELRIPCCCMALSSNLILEPAFQSLIGSSVCMAGWTVWTHWNPFNWKNEAHLT